MRSPTDSAHSTGLILGRHYRTDRSPHLVVENVLEAEFDTVDPQKDRTQGECEHHIALRKAVPLPFLAVGAFKHVGSHGVNPRPHAEILKIPLSSLGHPQPSPLFQPCCIEVDGFRPYPPRDRNRDRHVRTGKLHDLRSPLSLLLPIQPSQRAVRDFVVPAVSAVEELAVSVVGPNEWRIPATESTWLMLHATHGASSLAEQPHLPITVEKRANFSRSLSRCPGVQP